MDRICTESLPFELYKQPTETNEVIQAIFLFKVVMQRTVQKLHKLKRQEEKGV